MSVQLPVPKAPLCQRSPALCGNRLRSSSQRGYCRSAGRPKLDQETERLVVKMAVPLT